MNINGVCSTIVKVFVGKYWGHRCAMTTMAIKDTPLLAASYELNDMLLPLWSKENVFMKGHMRQIKVAI